MFHLEAHVGLANVFEYNLSNVLHIQHFIYAAHLKLYPFKVVLNVHQPEVFVTALTLQNVSHFYTK